MNRELNLPLIGVALCQSPLTGRRAAMITPEKLSPSQKTAVVLPLASTTTAGVSACLWPLDTP